MRNRVKKEIKYLEIIYLANVDSKPESIVLDINEDIKYWFFEGIYEEHRWFNLHKSNKGKLCIVKCFKRGEISLTNNKSKEFEILEHSYHLLQFNYLDEKNRILDQLIGPPQCDDEPFIKYIRDDNNMIIKMKNII